MIGIKKISQKFSNLNQVGKIMLFCSVSILFLFSCKTEENKGSVVAKVGEHELYSSDINFLSYSIADSSEVVSNYVTKWVEEKILIIEAEKSNAIDLEDIDRKVNEFKADLLIHQLISNLVNAQLDTNVSNKEIDAYYQKHKSDFQLNDYLVKVLYLKIPLDAPDIETIENTYKLKKEEDIKTIEEYAKIYASNFYYDFESWIYFDDILKEIPLHDINKDRFILKRSKIRFEETGFYYFLNIIDYKLKNSISPIDFERNNIKLRILNRRVKELREEIKNNIIKKGYDNNTISLY